MVVRDSNTSFITILDPLPLENIGWWLEVYDYATNSLLARVYSYLDFSFNVPLSDVGAFEWNMSDYDALWTSTLPNTQVGTYILDGGPHYVRFIDEGVERQRCIIDKHILGKVRENGERPRTITGKGVAVVLDWAIVLPTSIGASTSGNRTFTGVSWASAWMTLYNEAVAAGRLPSWVLPSFSATTDSLGVAWGDTGNYEIAMGQSLLDLLQQFSEQQGFEWRMRPDGTLLAAPIIGDDRSSTVRFFEHESIITADDTTDRTDLRTHVYVLGGDNLVSLASDSTAATTWGRREKWVSQSSATNADSRGAVANTLLGLAKNPFKSRSFKVPFYPKSPDGVDTHRRAFRDYETGVVVGYGPQTDSTTNYRIVEMAVGVSPNKTELEITVMSRLQREVDRLTRLLTRILAGQTGIAGAGGASGSVSSAVIAAAIRLGDLLNVNVAAAVAKDTIIFDGTRWNAGRSALDDLSDVDVSTATDGQMLIRSSGIWVGATGSGGGNGDLRWTPVAGRTYKYADEFNDATLGSGWARLDVSGGTGRATWTEQGDVLSVALAGGDASAELHTMLRAFALGVGDTVETCLTLAGPPSNYIIGGIVIGDGNAYGAGTQQFHRMFVSGGAVFDSWLSYTGYNTEIAGAVNTSVFPHVGPTFLKTVRSATNTYDCYWSPDGVSWILQNSGSRTMTPTYVGLVASSWGTATKSAISYEYLRVY